MVHVTQSVYESINDALNPDDLTSFQNYYNLLVQPIAKDIGGHVSPNACNTNLYADCYESNLDVQYMMGIAQNISTIYDYFDLSTAASWLDWITGIAESDNPATVYSISYATYEILIDNSIATAFDLEAIKLAVMGTTIFAASGDDGAVGYYAEFGSQYCGFYPMFPASSPYVTAVGGTSGPESGQSEIACMATPYQIAITSGGGFSNLYPAPSFQKPFIDSYFGQLSTSGLHLYSDPVSAYTTYNRSNRGYPDISLLAHNYEIFANGILTTTDGTSASTPTMAALTNLVNSERKKRNSPTMGWLNPFLYQFSSQFTNDHRRQ